jgi:hypothetical protein
MTGTRRPWTSASPPAGRQAAGEPVAVADGQRSPPLLAARGVGGAVAHGSPRRHPPHQPQPRAERCHRFRARARPRLAAVHEDARAYHVAPEAGAAQGRGAVGAVSHAPGPIRKPGQRRPEALLLRVRGGEVELVRGVEVRKTPLPLQKVPCRLRHRPSPLRRLARREACAPHSGVGLGVECQAGSRVARGLRPPAHRLNVRERQGETRPRGARVLAGRRGGGHHHPAAPPHVAQRLPLGHRGDAEAPQRLRLQRRHQVAAHGGEPQPVGVGLHHGEEGGAPAASRTRRRLRRSASRSTSTQAREVSCSASVDGIGTNRVV